MATRHSRFTLLLLLFGFLLGACLVTGDDGATTSQVEAALDGDEDPPTCENLCETRYMQCLGRARHDFDVCMCDNNNIGCTRACGGRGGGFERNCGSPEF